VVTDIVGCKDTATKTNYIQIKSPKPAFDAVDTSSICPPLETKFSLRGSDYESYYWDFGDGQTSLLQDPRHFYNTYGSYDAKLYVVGHGGCVDSVTKTINVFNPYATPINYSPLEACNELNVDFTISPPAHTRTYFFFGDGGNIDSSQATSFSHFYKAPSFYSPYMTLVDALDCQVVVGGPSVIKIYGAEPFFGIDKRAFCDSGTVFFTNYTITNDTIVNSLWNFGDGVTSTLINEVHNYGTPGTYYASLTASTTRGCIKTIYDTIKVARTPQPIITSADLVCINSIIQFNGSLAAADTSIKWSWTLGNGQTASQQNTATAYNAVGNPQVKLEATNFLGCKNDVSKNVAVVPLPEIRIFADPVIISGTGMVIPTTYSSNVISYAWTPASGLSCLDCANPYCKPQFTTKYKVSVIDSNGCASSRDITVTVICNDKNYFIPNTFSPNGDGMNDVFYPRGSGINRIQSMRIFNRWGEMVFEKRNFVANEASEGWDGRVKGKPADQDVYVYIIEFICDNAAIVPIRGNVALIR
jgi:gliding motility-associated-like protein